MVDEQGDPRPTAPAAPSTDEDRQERVALDDIEAALADVAAALARMG